MEPDKTETKRGFSKWLLEKFATRDVLVALLSTVIVFAAVGLAFMCGTDGVPDFLVAAFGAVVGYYFRGNSPVEPPK
jgi:hypothetical protein